MRFRRTRLNGLRRRYESEPQAFQPTRYTRDLLIPNLAKTTYLMPGMPKKTKASKALKTEGSLRRSVNQIPSSNCVPRYPTVKTNSAIPMQLPMNWRIRPLKIHAREIAKQNVLSKYPKRGSLVPAAQTNMISPNTADTKPNKKRAKGLNPSRMTCSANRYMNGFADQSSALFSLLLNRRQVRTNPFPNLRRHPDTLTQCRVRVNGLGDVDAVCAHFYS